MQLNTTIPRPTYDWDLDNDLRHRGHRLNPWLKRLDNRSYRRTIAADTRKEIDDALGEDGPKPLVLHFVPHPIRGEHANSRPLADELEVVWHSDGSVSCFNPDLEDRRDHGFV